MTRVEVVVAAVAAGGVGLVLAFFGLLDSCLPGTWSETPGWSCYSPPWAGPALVVGAVLMGACLVTLAAVGWAHLRAKTSD